MIDFIRGIFDRIQFGSQRSSRWRSVRNKYIKDNPRCEMTGSKRHLEIHHLFPYYLFPKLELDSKNLITLTRDCHFIFGHLCDWKAYNSTLMEDIEIYKIKKDNRLYE